MQPHGTVTMLFSDIEASTRLLHQLGTDRYSLALDEHRRLLRAAFAAHDGYEVACEGDSFFVAFPSASGAVAAAEEAQRALAGHRWPDALPVRVRIGIHTGHPKPTPPQYVGLDVHWAARVMAAAHGGQVLVTGATRQLHPSAVSFRDLGEHELKDIPATTRLFQLEADGLPMDFPPLRTMANRPTNLPAPARALIGRDRELAVLASLLSDPDVRLLTVTGVGGAGKSRLALEAATVAREVFSSGVFLVRLAPIRDSDMVVQTIAQALGVIERPGESLLDTLADHLRTSELLLLLDNFEQVAAAAPAMATLLEQAPKLKLLVTSRVRLRLHAERVMRLPPLETPPRDADEPALRRFAASALLLERIEAADAEFVLDDASAQAVAELCARLDGLPLALELAAARAALLSPQELLRRLGHRLDALGSAGPDAEEHQRTLRATLAWSYDLLPAEAQSLYGALAVLPGSWTLESAEALADERIDTVTALEALRDGNLVNRRRPEDGSSRFSMFETIREDALERLRDSGREAAVRDRLLEHACALADREASDFGLGLSWAEHVQAEHGLFRAAIDWGLERGRTDRALSLWLRIWLPWRDLAPGEVAAWGATLAERTRTLRTVDRVALLQAVIDIEGRRSSLLALRGQAHEALALARDVGESDRIANGLIFAGWCEYGHDPEQAVRLTDEAVERADRSGSEILFQALYNRIVFALAADNREKASADAAALLALARSKDYFVVMSLCTNAAVAVRLGDLEPALGYALEARERQAATPSAGIQAMASEALGLVRLFQGEDEPAAAELAHAFRLFSQSGYEHEARWALYVLAAATAALDPMRALLLAAAAGDLESILAGVPEWRVESGTLERRVTAATDAVDVDTSARLRAIGQRMTREELMAFALAAPASDRAGPDARRPADKNRPRPLSRSHEP
jgi:predicted ATPase/class 3 adenylate cyclase